MQTFCNGVENQHGRWISSLKICFFSISRGVATSAARCVDDLKVKQVEPQDVHRSLQTSEEVSHEKALSGYITIDTPVCVCGTLRTDFLITWQRTIFIIVLIILCTQWNNLCKDWLEYFVYNFHLYYCIFIQSSFGFSLLIPSLYFSFPLTYQ